MSESGPTQPRPDEQLLDELWGCLCVARPCTWTEAVEEAREIFDRYGYKPQWTRRLHTKQTRGH